MPTTLTLKNVPDAVYERLKETAEQHRRSLNNEAILCLETVLLPASTTVADRLERARRLRSNLSGTFAAQDFDTLKRDGRP